MPQKRKRYTDDGESLPCVVKINAKTARFLYREALERGYADETDLANDLIRRWAEGLDDMDWEDVLTKLKAAEVKASRRGGKAG